MHEGSSSHPRHLQNFPGKRLNILSIGELQESNLFGEGASSDGIDQRRGRIDRGIGTKLPILKLWTFAATSTAENSAFMRLPVEMRYLAESKANKRIF